jgi:heat shock protein 90kDa beta
VSNGVPGVPQSQKRLLSALVAPKVAGAGNVTSVKMIDGSIAGRRYESNAAAVDSSVMPPAEKYEYQAEVWINLRDIMQIKYTFVNVLM